MTHVHVSTCSLATEHGKDPSLENVLFHFTVSPVMSQCGECLPLNNKSFTCLLNNGRNHSLSQSPYRKRAVILKDTMDG